jgi:hypothetical protein
LTTETGAATLMTTMHEHCTSKRRRIIMAGLGCKSSLLSLFKSFFSGGDLAYNKSTMAHDNKGLSGEKERGKATIN